MPDRVVKTTLLIDEHGAVKAVKGVGEESARTEAKLGHLDKSAKGLGKTFGGLKGVIAGGIGAIGLGGLAFGLSDVVSKTKEVASETEKFSSITGIGATSSLRYTQALKARGLSGEAVTKAFGFLAKNMRTAELQEGKLAKGQATAAAKGKTFTGELGRQAKAFQELGISLTDFGKLSEEDKLKKITTSFEKLTDGQRKTRLERELFGRGGNQLSTVLDKNNLSLNHQIELTKKFYPTLKDGSRGLKELNEKSAESKMAWEGFQFTLGQLLIPTLTKAMAKFSEVVVEVEKGQGAWGELRRTFEGIAHFAGGVFGFISKIAGALGVKLSPGTLGAVLAAAGLAGKVPGVKPAAKVASKITKGALNFAGAHPYAAPAALAFAGGAYAGEKLNEAYPQGLFPGPSSLGAVERSFQGGQLTPGRGGSQRSEAGAVGGPKASDIIKAEFHVDGVKFAEMLMHNTRARRLVAEAATVYSQGMAARR